MNESASPRPRALVIDPSKTSASMLAAQLNEREFDVDHVRTLGQAIEALELERPRVLFSSFELGAFRAVSLVEALRADSRWRSVPVVVLASDLDCRRAFGRHHPDAFLLRNEFLFDNLERVLEDFGVGAASTASSSKILVAEDTTMNRLLLSRVLNIAGYEVVATENGREAVDEAGTDDFRVMIFDVEMPEMTGPEAVGVLRERGTSTPILALTGHDDEATRQRLLDAGFDAVQPKPFDRDALLNWIDQAGVRDSSC